jgi:hypothetical protein
MHVHRANDVRQMRTHTAAPTVHAFSSSDTQTATQKLKWYEAPSSDKILAKFIQAGCNILNSQIHKFVNFTSNKEGKKVTPPTCLLVLVPGGSRLP